jgi:hypothetical protein
MHHRIMVRGERESTNEIAGFLSLKAPIPAISNGSASGKQTPDQALADLFTGDYVAEDQHPDHQHRINRRPASV